MSLMNWYRVPKLAGSASLAITSAQPSYSGLTSLPGCSDRHIGEGRAGQLTQSESRDRVGRVQRAFSSPASPAGRAMALRAASATRLDGSFHPSQPNERVGVAALGGSLRVDLFLIDR